MFDDYNELSVNQLLENPDEKKDVIVSDLLKEELEEEIEEEDFFDKELLVQIRREVTASRAVSRDTGTGETAVSDTAPPVKKRFRFIWKLMKLVIGWRDFAGINPEFEKGIVIEAGEDRISVNNVLARERELIEQQIAVRKKEEVKSVSVKKETLSPFDFTMNTVKKADRFLLKFKKKYLKSNYILSIDIGRESLKYTLIRTGKDNLFLESYGIEPYMSAGTKEDNTESIVSALKNIQSRNYTDFAEVYVTISGILRNTKIITIPKVAQKELRDMVLFNLRKDSAFQTKEEMAVEYYIMGVTEEKGADKYNMLAIWTPQQQINKYYTIIKESGITPSKITFPETGPWEFCKYFMSDAVTSAGILFDVGFQSTYLLFHDQCIIKFIREIRTGSQHFTEALAGDYPTPQGNKKIDLKDAEKIKQEFGIPPSDNESQAYAGITYSQIHERLGPVLEKYISEIVRSVNYYRSQYPKSSLKTISLSGGGGLMLHLDEYIADATGLEIKPVSLFERMKIGEGVLDGYSLSRNYHKLINSVGIALEEHDALNFLPQEMKSLKKKAQLGLVFLTASALILILLSVFTIAKLQDRGKFNSLLFQKKEQWESVGTDKKMFAALMQEKEEVSVIKNDMADKISGSLSEQKTELVLKILSKVIPSSIYLNSAVYTEGNKDKPENIVLEGDVGDTDKTKEEVLFDFYLQLEQSGYFSKVIVDKENKKDSEESAQLPDFIVTCYF